MTILIVCLSLAAGNFIFQAITKKDWETACQYSIMQAIAVVAYVIASPILK